jgi:CO/xanthine dehydrogenase FAD-binding subunit
VLESQALNNEVIEQAVAVVTREISPIDDVRASAWYRKHLTGVYIRRALTHVAGN